MGSTIPKYSELSVASFRQLTPGVMAGVLEAQRREWLERLDWDLGEISRFLGDAIRARSLRGSAVLRKGVPVGFGFFTFEMDRCLIGDLYVAAEHRDPEANAVLATGVLRQIAHSKTRKRIESQSVCFDATGIDEAFAGEGFTSYDRDYLACSLAEREFVAKDHGRVEVRGWRDSDFSLAVEAIFQAYRGTLDARMNCQYQTREGCADLLDALTDSAWCGTFDHELTSVATDRSSGRLCGVAVCSRVSIAAAHLGQISVLPIFQGEGIGRAMIIRSLDAARRRGCSVATLAVTRENTTASRLYRAVGFTPRLAFSVYARDGERSGLSPAPRRPSGVR